MTATAEMLFNIQKFQVLSLYVSDSQRNVTDAYAYAWDAGVYPIASDAAAWHKPFGECFEVGEEQMSELATFLDERWTSKSPISFYELEDHYGISGSARPGADWERGTLVAACRYLKLEGWFDDEFWAGVVGHSDCPSESHCVRREFRPSDIYFL